MSHKTKIKVRGYHLDFYGHVNNARYLEFLEEARWSFLEGTIDLADWQKRGLGFVVASITINYRRTVGLNAVLAVSTEVARVGGKSGVVHQEVVDTGSGELAADADVTFVIVDLTTGKPVPLQGEVLAGLRGEAP